MAQHLNTQQASFSVGDTVKVYQLITEDGGKTRTQIFEGVVISIKNRESGKTFTVRRIASNGIGVERIFPLYSPNIQRIEKTQSGAVRRAKLYYLRDRVGKAAMNIRKKLNNKPRA